MKSFTFNKVYIVRSLNPNNTQLLAPGDLLYQQLNLQNVPCELCDVSHGIVDFNQIMNKIVGDCVTKDIKPIIHFICHGAEPCQKYPNGALALWDHQEGSIIYTWDKILPYLEHINIVCKLNLFVSMCVCYGFYSLLHLLDESHRIPFCGLLASPDPINLHCAIVGFARFYESLIANKSTSTAIDDLQKSLMPLKNWYEQQNIPMERFLVLFSDDLFTHAAKEDFQKNRSSIFKLWKLGLYIFKRIKNRNIRNHAIVAFIKENYKKYPSLFKRMKDHKFMLDIYPDQQERFDLPKDIKDLMKQNKNE